MHGARQSRPGRARRLAGTTVVTALLLVPLLALVAFAVDLNHIWRCDAELQTAADAAAQAGATRLMGFDVQAASPDLGALGLLNIELGCSRAVKQRAVEYGQMHRAGDTALVVNPDDVELGFIADPTAGPDTPAGRFLTGLSAPFPNSVRVTVRRDNSVSTGPVNLFFGPVLGTPSSSRLARATATLRGQNVIGFSGSPSRLLPLAVSLQYFLYLTAGQVAPLGLLLDNFTVQLPIAGAALPPGNVCGGKDGVPEVTLTPAGAPLNWGLVSLRNAPVMDLPSYSTWVRSGPSAADLASFGPGGLRATPLSPTLMYVGPAIQPALVDDFAAVIGQPRVVVIVGPPVLLGGLRYPALGFTGATVVAADRSANTITIQLCPVIDTTAVLGGGPSVGYTQFVYRGISLSR